MQAQITTIKPTSGFFTSFQPRSKEGEEKRSEIHAVFSLPMQIESIGNVELKGFAIRAYCNAVNSLLRDAVKAGQAEFTIPAIAELFSEAKREFLITKPELLAWINSFALPIISAAIATKSGLSLDSVKVVKKAIAYRELLLLIASRSIMMQEQIDSCLKVLELVTASGKTNDYSDNVIQAIARKQEKLNDYLAGNADDENEIDF